MQRSIISGFTDQNVFASRYFALLFTLMERPTVVRVLAIKELLGEVEKTSYGQKSKVVLEYLGL